MEATGQEKTSGPSKIRGAHHGVKVDTLEWFAIKMCVELPIGHCTPRSNKALYCFLIPSNGVIRDNFCLISNLNSIMFFDQVNYVNIRMIFWNT
jgi:hypothetical protein